MTDTVEQNTTEKSCYEISGCREKFNFYEELAQYYKEDKEKARRFVAIFNKDDQMIKEAILDNNLFIIEILLDSGVDTKTIIDGLSLLIFATANHKTNAAMKLIDKDVKVTENDIKNAEYHGHAELVKYMQRKSNS